MATSRNQRQATVAESELTHNRKHKVLHPLTRLTNSIQHGKYAQHQTLHCVQLLHERHVKNHFP